MKKYSCCIILCLFISGLKLQAGQELHQQHLWPSFEFEKLSQSRMININLPQMTLINADFKRYFLRKSAKSAGKYKN